MQFIAGLAGRNSSKIEDLEVGGALARVWRVVGWGFLRPKEPQKS